MSQFPKGECVIGSRFVSSILFALALILAGCGGSSSSDETASQALSDSTEIAAAAAAFKSELEVTKQEVVERMPASGYVDNSLIPKIEDLAKFPDFEEVVSLKVGAPWVFNDEAAPWFVAQELGFFREAGIEVDLIEGGPGRNPMTLLLAEKLDIAVAANSGDIPSAIASVTGGDVVIVGTVLKQSPVSVVSLDTTVPKAQRSDRVITPLDMRGKVFGVQAGSERLAQIFLKANGLPEGDVEITRIGNGPDLLANGRVDFMLAWIVNQPRILEDQGFLNWISFPLADTFYSSPADISVIKRDFLEAQPDVVWRYNWALLKAVRYMLDRSKKAAEITYSRIPDAGLSVEQIVRRFDLQRSLIEGDDPENLMFVSPDEMDELVAYYVQAGIIELPLPD